MHITKRKKGGKKQDKTKGVTNMKRKEKEKEKITSSGRAFTSSFSNFESVTVSNSASFSTRAASSRWDFFALTQLFIRFLSGVLALVVWRAPFMVSLLPRKWWWTAPEDGEEDEWGARANKCSPFNFFVLLILDKRERAQQHPVRRGPHCRLNSATPTHTQQDVTRIW